MLFSSDVCQELHSGESEPVGTGGFEGSRATSLAFGLINNSSCVCVFSVGSAQQSSRGEDGENLGSCGEKIHILSDPRASERNVFTGVLQHLH